MQLTEKVCKTAMNTGKYKQSSFRGPRGHSRALAGTRGPRENQSKKNKVAPTTSDKLSGQSPCKGT